MKKAIYLKKNSIDTPRDVMIYTLFGKNNGIRQTKKHAYWDTIDNPTKESIQYLGNDGLDYLDMLLPCKQTEEGRQIS